MSNENCPVCGQEMLSYPNQEATPENHSQNLKDLIVTMAREIYKTGEIEQVEDWVIDDLFMFFKMLDKHEKAVKKEKQKNCDHENTATHYDYIPGEAVKEPQYRYCVDCGLNLTRESLKRGQGNAKTD